MKANKKNLFKAAIITIVALLILGVWYMKNSKSNNEDTTSIQSDNFTLEVDSIELDNLKSYNIPIIIDFGATECIPCKEMAPVLKKLNKKYENKVFIKFVDVWKHGEAANDFPVQIIPTQIIIDSNGKPYQPKSDLGVELVTYTYKNSDEIAFTAHQGALNEDQLESILKDMGVKDE